MFISDAVAASAVTAAAMFIEYTSDIYVHVYVYMYVKVAQSCLPLCDLHGL